MTDFITRSDLYHIAEDLRYKYKCQTNHITTIAEEDQPA